jgi:phosphoglycerol geranylgeranyltransferase
MRFIYLEGGSGVSNPVPTDMVRMVKTVVGGPLIVGGGIRTGNQARDIVAAGADVIVTSTILEKTSKGSIREKMTEIMEGIKEGVKNKKIR